MKPTPHYLRHRPAAPVSRGPVFTYSHFDELCASPTQPMPQALQAHQVGRMRAGLHELRTAEQPSYEAWRLVSDAANLLETLVEEGYASDPHGAVHDAVRELALCGARHLQDGVPLRLSGVGITTLQGAIDDYETILAALSHRTAIRIHRKTEKRLREILSGKRRAHDVEIVKV